MTPYCTWPLLLVAACHLAACADSGAAPASACPAPAQGGAAPPSMLSADQHKALKDILSRYKPERMDPAQAKALREALCKAGLVDGPALHKAMADLGFSAKQLAVMSNDSPQASPAQDKPIVTPSGRVVPPRP